MLFYITVNIKECQPEFDISPKYADCKKYQVKNKRCWSLFIKKQIFEWK